MATKGEQIQEKELQHESGGKARRSTLGLACPTVLQAPFSSPSCPWPVSWTQLPGRSNEDAVCINVSGVASMFAVFDGHGGRSVANLASRRAPEHFWKHPAWPEEPCEALRGVLHGCHEEAREASLVGGSTAAIAVVADGRISCANAGDARAVVGLRAGGAKRLTVDHKASVESEAERVRAAGGFVIKGRLCAVIAVTRGLGDFDFEEMGMTCEPHLSSIPVDEVDFIVLASDGLWDVLDDETCCSMVRSWGRQDTVAHRLANHARHNGTDDDLTVIVVWLDDAAAAAAASTTGTSVHLGATSRPEMTEPAGQSSPPAPYPVVD